MDTYSDIITTAQHLKQVYPGIPQQVGMCDRAGINSAIFEGLRGRASITKGEAVALVQGIMQREYPGRKVMAAWTFVSYEGSDKEAGQVAILMGADSTIYRFPAGSAIIATTPKA